MKLKEYECGICKMRFAQKKSRDKHISVVHEGIRPFKCDYCDKEFGINSQKKDHMERVHGCHVVYALKERKKNSTAPVALL